MRGRAHSWHEGGRSGHRECGRLFADGLDAQTALSSSDNGLKRSLRRHARPGAPWA
jgi:hypothetical protein